MGATPGGLWVLGRRKRWAPSELAGRRDPRPHLRTRPLPEGLLRLRPRPDVRALELHVHLHPALLGRFRLVLRGPCPLLLVPDGKGPRPRSDAQLSVGQLQPTAPALPVVLPPCWASARAAVRRSRVGPRVLHVPVERRVLRGAHGVPRVRAGQGSLRPEGG